MLKANRRVRIILRTLQEKYFTIKHENVVNYTIILYFLKLRFV